MGNPILLLSWILLATLLGTDAEDVEWPSDYSVEWTLRDRSAHYTLDVKQRRSQKENAYRFDTYGGTNTFILTFSSDSLTAIYYYFPIHDKMICNQVSLNIPVKKLPPGFPELRNFIHSTNLTVNGAAAQEWSTYGGKVKFWLHVGDGAEGPIPIKSTGHVLEGNDEKSVLNQLNLVVDYYNYEPREGKESVWHGLKNIQCQPPAEQSDITDLFTYINLISLQLSFEDNKQLERAKGLNKRDEMVGSAQPFPYSDYDIQRMAKQLPKNFDWRNAGAVTAVKNQGFCGSCWAFSTAGAIEGAYFLRTGVLGDVSVQALIDCGWWTDPNNGLTDGGCFGGFPSNAFDWMKGHGGLPWAADYGDYKQINGRCTLSNVKPVSAVKGYVSVKANVDAAKVALVQHGPLSASISTPSEFMSYTNGVLKIYGDQGDTDHAVLLVGYGSLNGEDYWMIKNSWGESWGLRGYGLVSTENNTLNLLDNLVYPILE